MRATWSIARLGAAVLLALAFAPAPAGAAEPIDIGQRLELFVDDFLAEELKGAEFRLHAPVRAGAALAFDRPWEGKHAGYVTVFKDGALFRMYYRGLPKSGGDGSDAEVTCYAESRNGVDWKKPELGLFDHGGSKRNNIILAGAAPFSHNFAPMLDARPGVDPAERYKALAGISSSGLFAFVSADGIHWKKLREEPVFRDGIFDSQNIAFWSEAEGQYVCYFRSWKDAGGQNTRWISRTTSPDFVKWSAPVEMNFGGAPPEHLYTNQTAPYARAPHLYLGLAARFMEGRKVISDAEGERLGTGREYSGDISETVLITSRGGDRFDRKFMQGFIRPGLGKSNWTSRTNYAAHGIVETSDAELSMFVQRNYGQPTHFLERLTLRVDGFGSVSAPYSGGEMRTRAIKFSGKELAINYATSAAGEIRAEIQDEAGAAIAGYGLADCDAIIGDEIERAVRWKGNSDLSAIAGKPVRLRFQMKDADLFALRFR